MSRLVDYVNGLKYDDTEPVSFLFHLELGAILNRPQSNFNNLDEDEKVMLDSDNIDFIL